jgi:acyl-CoA synthetase (AMP-forming)/AMP-acid ligase II
MTADYIAFHAIEQPNAVAFLDNGRAVTYAQFNREIRQFMRGVSQLGLSRGRSVGIGCHDLYLHWVLLLALQRLGITTASLQRDDGTQPKRDLGGKLDALLSEWDFPLAADKPRHAVTPEWVKAVRDLPEIDEASLPPKAGDDVIRIVSTAGTTGDPKLIRTSRNAEEGRSRESWWTLGLTSRSRYLLTAPFNTGWIYPLADAVNRVGGTIVLETRVHIAHALSAHSITHLVLFPIHLKEILDTLPERFVKPANLAIHTFGATLSEALRERTMARLATALYDSYGSREASFVSRIARSDSGGIGAVGPDVEVQVVDDAGNPLPNGQIGRLKIKTPFMLTDYIDDPGATGQFFKDGWLLSGDLAVLHGPRRLQIVGRRDEMVNVGGNKMSPSAIEDFVLRLINARDIGVVSVPNPDGIEELWIAVADAQHGDQELLTRIAAGLRTLQFVSFHVVRLGQIPRNPSGKIQRDLLKQALAGGGEVTTQA